MSKKKSNSPFTFKIVQQAADLNFQVVKPTLFAEPRFLAHTAEFNPHIDHEVVEVKNGDEVIANLYYQIMPFKGSELKSYIPNGEDCIINKTMEAIVDLALERINWSLAVLGNVFITGDNGQYWVKELDSTSKWQVIQNATKFLSEKIKIDAILISDLREEDLKNHEALLSNNYRFFEVEPDLVFDIDSSWESFDDYLASIVSKYRVRTKKVLKNSEALTIKDLDAKSIKAQEEAIYSLYKNVVDSAAFKLAEVKKNYFYDFKKTCPETFFVRAYYLEDKLVGVISFFNDNQCLHINFVGLDYGYNKEHCIYQRILYDCIEQGILFKKAKIHFGRTASEIKTSVGAYPIKAYSLLKHNNKIPNLAIKPLTTYLKPEPFEVRNPFGNKKVS